jgi:cation diffusion facilitator family transporter
VSHTLTCDQDLHGHPHEGAAGPAGPARYPAGRRVEDPEHRRAATRAVGVSALGLALTGAVEMALAALTGSVALLGDALHNLSDVSTSVAVFVGFRCSRRAPNERYPYGFERAEDLAGLGVALVIWASAVVAGIESYRKLTGHGHTTAVYVGMIGAAMGIAGNQLVARYKLRVGRRIHSATLVADARHSWLDALSSAGALIGLALVAAGIRWGDPIAGLAVTVFILHVGWEVTVAMIHRLMDGVDPQRLEAATRAALSVPGVQDAFVRGRWTGRSLILEVSGQIRPDLTVRDADTLGAQTIEAVLDAVPEARQATWTAHSTRVSR